MTNESYSERILSTPTVRPTHCLSFMFHPARLLLSYRKLASAGTSQVSSGVQESDKRNTLYNYGERITDKMGGTCDR
jgi:hypothetical protein